MNAPDRPEPVRWRALWPAAEYFSAFILSELPLLQRTRQQAWEHRYDCRVPVFDPSLLPRSVFSFTGYLLIPFTIHFGN